MRHWGRVVAALAIAGCADPATPTTTIGTNTQLVAVAHSEDVPPIVYNTQLRSELEVPACESAAKGLAQIKILQDGTIESMVIINNKGETVLFGHIHHVIDGAPTGPVIWWLSSPIGTALNLTQRHIDIRQNGAFVASTHFDDEESALAALLDDPGSFYVNFHSSACPGGFARGFLP